MRWAAAALTCAVAFGAFNLARAADSTWHPPACPPPPDNESGRSSIKVTGPCGFESKAEAECEVLADDMQIILTRKAKNNAELMLYVNVERYVGPGTYKAPNDIFVSVLDGTKIYRWWSNQFVATVNAESKSVTLKDVKLEPELLLVGCTGPQDNYQCDGRGDEPKHMETMTSVSGTIVCKRLKKRHDE
jgi:hypothetical protein